MKCPYCNSTNTKLIYKAEMPNILSACSGELLDKIKVLPFRAELCKDCLLGFNTSKLDDEELKLIYDNYLYISPLQGTGVSKYTGMIATLRKYFSSQDMIIEIGCSEGYLLKELMNIGYTNLVGIEPGPQADQAKELGLNIIKGYFDENTFCDNKVDGFFLMHVFEHFDKPFEILESMKKQLAPSGKIIIEVPNFDGFHHQHLFFYNSYFFDKLCKGLNLKIIDKNIDMGALRVVIVHEKNDMYDAVNVDESKDQILKYATDRYTGFEKHINQINETLAKNLGKKVFWWGAGSLSVIYLNQINKDILDKVELVILDGDHNKYDFYVPGINLKVNSYEMIKNSSVNAMIIASSFYKEIQRTMDNNNIRANEIVSIY